MKRILMLPVVATIALSLWTVAMTASAPPAAEAGGETSADEQREDEQRETEKAVREVPDTLEEARGRARLLHETIHGTLQVVHRDFYREGEKLPLPSRSLENVFAELARSYDVKIRWLAVNAQAMNVDHEPQDEFETQAVQALAAGQTEFGLVEDGRYRHVGRVRLAAECLGCHISSSSRTNSNERAAGLAISIPFGKN